MLMLASPRSHEQIGAHRSTAALDSIESCVRISCPRRFSRHTVNRLLRKSKYSREAALTTDVSSGQCDGGFCGLAAAIVELRSWAESSGIHRYEVFGFLLIAVVLVTIAYRLPSILTVLNERRVIELDHKRQDNRLQDMINREREKRSHGRQKRGG